MTALRTTFYSYKGGVGRTLALLNVATILAASGRKVIAVDLDLEAPGFGLSSLTTSENATSLGATDLLHNRFHGGNADIESFCYQPTELLGEIGENLWLMPAGTHSDWLLPLIPQIYGAPQAAAAELFSLLHEELDAALTPDFILFDSRTGRADIAGVALLQLAQVVFAMCGLNDQNVLGMEKVLSDLRDREEPEWPSPLTLLGLGPIPQLLDERAYPKAHMSRPAQSPIEAVLERPVGDTSSLGWILRQRLEAIKARLLVPIQEQFAKETRQRFSRLSDNDLLHLFDYDPAVLVGSELVVPVSGKREAPQTPFSASLVESYYRLARVIALARPEDPGLSARSSREVG